MKIFEKLLVMYHYHTLVHIDDKLFKIM